MGAANAPSTQTGTTVIISGTGNYETTIQMLEKFFPIDEVIENIPEPVQIGSGEIIEIDTDITVVLGNSYIDARPAQFNYNM